MPIARIQMPDGRIARVDVPEGTTPEEAMAFVSQQIGLSDDPAAAVVPDAEPPGLVGNVGRAAVKGASQALGFPGEVALGIPKAGAWLAGDDEALGILQEVDPTGAFKDVFGALGMRSDPDLEGRPFRERFLANTAEAVAGGAVGVGVGGQARGVIRPAAEKLAGGKFGKLFGEDAAAGGAGAFARTSLEELGAGSELEAAGEFATSVLTGSSLAKARLLRDAWDGKGKLLEEYSSSERKRAGTFMQDTISKLGEDPEDLARLLREASTQGSEGMILPGARVDSVALTMLENGLIQSSPELQAKFQRSGMDLKTFIRQEMTEAIGEGAPQDFVDWYMKSSDYAIELSEKAYQGAIERAAREVSDLPPIGVDYSTAVKQRLREHKQIDRDIEKELWSSVQNRRVPISSGGESKFLKESYDELLQEQSVAERAGELLDMPESATMRVLKSISEGDEASVSELLTLRSSLLDDAAEASANGQKNLSRRLNSLADGALNTLESVEGEEIAQARSFSRALNDRYSRDVITPILAQSRNRDELVAGNEVMGRIFRPGESGRTGVRALMLASGELPEDASNYILQRFHERVIRDGRIDTGEAQKFISQYRPALDESGLMKTAESYLGLGRAADEAESFKKLLTSDLGHEPTMRILKSYGETPDDIVNAISAKFRQKAGSAQDTLSSMYAEASTDLSGNALAGLKSMTVDAVLKSAYTAADTGSTLLPEISARVRNSLSATGHFSDQEVMRVERVLTSLYKETKASQRRALAGRSTTVEDAAKLEGLGSMAKMAALKFVAPAVTKGAGGGSLSLAGMIGRGAQRVVEKLSADDAASLVKRAIFDNDDELLTALLTMQTDKTGRSAGVIRKSLDWVRRFAVEGGLRPSQVTIVNDEIIEEENRE